MVAPVDGSRPPQPPRLRGMTEPVTFGGEHEPLRTHLLLAKRDNEKLDFKQALNTKKDVGWVLSVDVR